jgi:hypothetical protein
MPRIFDAWGDVEVRDKVDAGLKRVRTKVRETVEAVDAMEGTATLKADSTQVTKEIGQVEQKLRRLDRMEADVGVDMDTSKFEKERAKLEARLMALRKEKVSIEVDLDRNNLNLVNRGLATLYQRMQRIGRISPWNDIRRLGDALHNARITLGPLSLSLRGLIVTLLALAPLVSAAAGAVGGLSAALGQALIGSVGLAGAAVMGFGAILGGVIGAIVVHRKQFKQFGDDVKDLGAEFKRQTRIPTSFFDAIREGIATARADMPILTRATNTALNTIGERFTGFFRSLRSGTIQGALKDLFGNTNEALGPLLRGLNSLARAAILIGTSFSRHLPETARNFRDWAMGVEDAARNTDKLNDTVDDLWESTKAVGRVFGQAARLVANFFTAGGPAGRKMADEIADLLRDWADFLGSKKGQKDVTNFLNDAWETTKKFAALLEQVVGLIENLATAGKPIVDWLLDAGTWALRIVNRLADATGAGEGLVTGLAGLIILKRAIGWATTLMAILGGGTILKAFKGLARFSLEKILFGTGGAAALSGKIRSALSLAFRGAFSGLGGALAGAFAGFKVSEMLGLGGLKDSLDAAGRTFSDLGRAAENVWNRIKQQFSTKLSIAVSVGRGVIGAARSVWNTVKRTLSRAIDFVFSLPNPIGLARTIWNRVKNLVSSAIGFVFSLPNPIGAARSLWNRVKGVITDGIQFAINLPGVGGLVSIAQSIWDAVNSALPDITLNISIPKPSLPSLPSLDPRKWASGGIARGFKRGNGQGDPVTARQVAAAAQQRGMPGWGGKISSPRFINNVSIAGEELGNSEFIIPTNPRFRSRARRLLAQAFATVGQGFARGKGGKGKRGKRRPKKVYSGSHYLGPVRQLEDEIAVKDNALTVMDRRYNTDSRFMPMVDDDGQRLESNIRWHVRQLDAMADRAMELSRLEQRLSAAITTANRQLRKAMDAFRKRRPNSTIVKGSGKDKKRVENPEFKKWADKMEGLQGAYGEVPLSDAQAARFRSDSYADDAYSYRADIREARETRSTPLAGGGMEGFLKSTGLFETFQNLNLAAAKASATIGDTADDRAAASGMASFWESVINRLGPGGDKDLLTEAYGNLASARQSASDTSGPTMESQLLAYDQARTELYRQFGGNMGGAGILGAITSGVTSGVVAGLSGGGGGAGGGSTPTSGAQGGAGRQTVINQTNNFAAPPPDPHTFTQSVKWQAQAVL